jgi:hypothetical protein
VFLSMEADRLPWVLAARAGGLPYNWARMSLDRNVHVLTYRSADVGPGQPGRRAGSDCGSESRSTAVRWTISSPPAGASTTVFPGPPSPCAWSRTAGRCTPRSWRTCTTS